MKYYRCSCSATDRIHTTADHAGHGKAECLIDGCSCKAMAPGEEIEHRKKPAHPFTGATRQKLPLPPVPSSP